MFAHVRHVYLGGLMSQIAVFDASKEVVPGIRQGCPPWFARVSFPTFDIYLTEEDAKELARQLLSPAGY